MLRLILSLALTTFARADPCRRRCAKAPPQARAPASREAGPGSDRGQAGQRDDRRPAQAEGAARLARKRRSSPRRSRRSVRGFLDIDQLGKRAMVDNWAKLTQDAAGRVLTLLRDADRGQLRRAACARTCPTGRLHRRVDRQGRQHRRHHEDQHQAQGPPVHDRGRLRPRQGRRQAAARGTSRPTASAWSRTTARCSTRSSRKDGFDGLIAKMKKKQSQAAT